MMGRTGLLPLLIAGIVAAGCQTAGMEFTRRADLEILTPRDREEVSLPVVVTWEPSDEVLEQFADNEGELFYAVFVDRPPVSAGANLAGLAGESCRRTPGCADVDWFNERGVFFTVVPVLTLRDLDDLRDDGAVDARDLHRVTVVIMRRGSDDDAVETAITGVREGESSFTREFYVRREEPA